MSLQRFLHALERLWHWVALSQANLPENDRQRARLLSILTASVLVVFIPFAPIWIISTNFASASFLVMATSFIGISFSWFFSRTPYYRWSARFLFMVLVVGLGIVFFSNVFRGSDPPALTKYLILGVLMVSLILSVRETIAVAIACFVAVYFSCRIVLRMPENWLVNELAFNGFSSMLIITAAIVREQYIDRLRASEHRYRALFQQSNDAVFIMKLNGDYETVNQRTADMLGYSIDELMRSTFRNIVVPSEIDHAENVLERLLEGKVIPPYERTFRKKDGSKISVEINVELVRDEAGNPMHLQSIVRDISNRKKEEQARIQFQLERERGQILANFVRGAAHEFRTPLSVIGTNVYLLTRDTDPNSKPRRLHMVEQQVDRISRLVDLMITMVKLDTIETLHADPIQLNGLVSSIIDTFYALVNSKSLHINLQLFPELPIVYGDAAYLAEALRNIVHNAIMYTPENGMITVQTTLTPEGISVDVQDSGIGIDPESFERVFERFYRSDVARTTEGFGLGLSIARAVVQRHGGRIDVKSTLGVGTTFSMIFPLSQKALPAGVS